MSGLLAARILVLLFLCCAAYGGRIPQSRPTIAPRSSSSCQPFHATFNSDSPVIPSHRQEYSGSTFVATSEEGSYKLGNGGLELYLVHPDCEVTRKDKVNDIVGDGATINSTFTLKYAISLSLGYGSIQSALEGMGKLRLKCRRRPSLESSPLQF